jgi:hypothetical protein
VRETAKKYGLSSADVTRIRDIAKRLVQPDPIHQAVFGGKGDRRPKAPAYKLAAKKTESKSLSRTKQFSKTRSPKK